MAINARKNVDRTLLELKQASVARMLGQAKALHEQGQLRKVTAPTSRLRGRSEPLRVHATEA
jgi:hypothetical protein